MENKIFDEEYYLNKYPDVKAAIPKLFKSGFDHYRDFGMKEGRDAVFKTEIQNQIDINNPGLEQHLTLQGYKAQPKRQVTLNMVNVPEEFRPIQFLEYPKGNINPFERYFTDKFIELKPNTFRTYLPIHWTSYYVNNKYGTDKEAIKKLQKYIDTLDKKKKYFTIVQYDDGILNDIKNIDLLVYSMGCKKTGYYPIPLISQPLNNQPTIDLRVKNKLYSFNGAKTHPIREQLVKELKNEFVNFKSLQINEYYGILNDSVFALCPRGYGITSFRMFEAMYFNCIPVYISDYFWEPFNIPFSEYGIKIRPDEINVIPEILAEIDIKEKQVKVKQVYEKYFVYSQCANVIIKTLV
jgi:hypothetical protein